MDEPAGPRATPASVRGIAKAVIVSALAALVLLVTAILPAEYGIDPLGTGRALGLSMLSGTAALAPVPPPQGDALAPVQEGLVAFYPDEYRYDARELTLGPYEYLEFKYHLAEGATMLFAWEANGDVRQDFHGDRDGATANAAESFDKQPRREAYGSFSAPFFGIHGWYWENLGAATITVRLVTAGFYTQAHEFHYDRTRVVRQVRSLDTIDLRRE